jgi:hypothetical protein
MAQFEQLPGTFELINGAVSPKSARHRFDLKGSSNQALLPMP